MRKVIGTILLVITCGYGFYLDITTVAIFFGMGGVAISLVMFPITYVLVPIYWLLNGAWFPILFIFGGTFLGFYIYGLGDKQDELP